MRFVLFADGVEKVLPQIALDEKGRAEHQAGHFLVPEGDRGDGMTSQRAERLARGRGQI